MKKVELRPGIKETTKSYLVDLDEYHGRERYYTGTIRNEVLRFDKKVHPDLLNKWNFLYPTVLDLLLALRSDGEKIKGVSTYRKGYVVE